MTDLAEMLGGMDVNDYVRVTLTDGTTFEGQADPIDYDPEESLRLEIRPPDKPTERYEIRSEYDGGWDELAVRRVAVDEPNADWEELGTVEDATVTDEPA
ncbi:MULTISPECIES: hypothetical protein [Halorussus]|uniref:hypothetical protein n=1 Tax=Halorussus TaxID=1070314 RepID=UPI0020A0FED1|nr:hypothetical protein [Halorussus vallis]USZ75860.1 hypothetical protein NGM07_00725 [Halorussus vallis]